MKKRIVGLGLVVISLAAFQTRKTESSLDEVAYQKEIKEWQQKREADLRSASSPLNLISIFWLKEGVNSFGSAADNDFVFPKGKLAEHAGKYIVKNDTITLQLFDKSGIGYKGATVVAKSELPSPDDTKTGAKDTTIRLNYGSLNWFVFISGGRLAVRVLDVQSENQKNFKGVEGFPADLKWKIAGKFEPYAPDTKVSITTVKGNTNLRKAAGLVTFQVNGKEYKLEALDRGTNLFFVFSDKTGERGESYEFRFLSAKKPSVDGVVIVDFNKATNPNCAFSPHAPCPLPPTPNRLSIAIPAGEKKYNNPIKN